MAEKRRITRIVKDCLKNEELPANPQTIAELKKVQKVLGCVERIIKPMEGQTDGYSTGFKRVVSASFFIYGGVRTRLQIIKETKKEELVLLQDQVKKPPEFIEISLDLEKTQEEKIDEYIQMYESVLLKQGERNYKIEELSEEYKEVTSDIRKMDYVPNKVFELLRFGYKELGQ